MTRGSQRLPLALSAPSTTRTVAQRMASAERAWRGASWCVENSIEYAYSAADWIADARRKLELSRRHYHEYLQQEGLPVPDFEQRYAATAAQIEAFEEKQ